MNNDQYLSILKKRLSAMDKSSRDEILLEINSHADALGGSSESLYERFGDPDILAKQYLEDEPLKSSASKKVKGIGKYILTAIGVVASILLAGLVILYNIYTGDDFDYADEQSPQLSLDSAEWQTMDWSQAMTLEVEQSKVVFYWNNRNLLAWNCKGRNTIPLNHQGKIKIKQSSCLVSLPNQKTLLQTRQSSIVVVRPQAPLEIEINQSSLRIAENEAGYRYAIERVRSEMDNFMSSDSAEIEIQIAAMESTISKYSY